jgi:hypothetical protein
MKQITTSHELRSALSRLGMNRHDLSDAMRKKGISATPQAVWKWTTGKTRGLPGYVGYFFLTQFKISKETLQQ